MSKKGSFKDRTGENHITNEGYPIKIIECFSAINCTIQFEDGTILRKFRYDAIKDGRVRNPFHPSVCGIGYLGIGRHKPIDENKKLTKIYTVWNGMFQRCYNENIRYKFSTYKGCTVDKSWHNFQNFADWYENNHKSHMKGWHIDKDILKKGNKIYSPETCCFIPIEINSLFTKCNKARSEYPISVNKRGKKFRAYIGKDYIATFSTIEEAFLKAKEVKEIKIKFVADEWQPLIEPEVYQAMYNYKVEITD